MIHLDASFLIHAAITGSPEARRLADWIRKNAEIAISAVAWAEFLCGPVSREQAALAARIIGEPVAFTAEDGTRASAYFNATGRRRGTLLDCMIAAAAVGAGASLATPSPSDFHRFEDLDVLTA